MALNLDERIERHSVFRKQRSLTGTECTPGEPGEERELDLELQFIADCGLVGLPNAGKSTFLAQATSADPRIADYPFTTLSPHLGVAALGGDRSCELLDAPELIARTSLSSTVSWPMLSDSAVT